MAAEAMVSQSESGPRYAFGLPAIFYSKRVGWTEWTESGPSLPAFWYSKRVVDRGTRGSVIILYVIPIFKDGVNLSCAALPTPSSPGLVAIKFF